MKLVYSQAEVAEMLGIHVTTVAKLIKDGELPAIRIGRRVLIRPTDLDHYILKVHS